MKRRSTACKMVQIFFLVAMAIMLSVPVWAQETALTAVVPSHHTLHVEVMGAGSVAVDGVVYTKTGDVQVPRQHRPEISVLAADGSKIKTVLWDNQNVTAAFQGGKWLAFKVISDTTLTVTFENVGSPPKSGDSFHWEPLSTLLIGSILGLAICLLLRTKEYT